MSVLFKKLLSFLLLFTIIFSNVNIFFYFQVSANAPADSLENLLPDWNWTKFPTNNHFAIHPQEGLDSNMDPSIKQCIRFHRNTPGTSSVLRNFNIANFNSDEDYKLSFKVYKTWVRGHVPDFKVKVGNKVFPLDKQTLESIPFKYRNSSKKHTFDFPIFKGSEIGNSGNFSLIFEGTVTDVDSDINDFCFFDIEFKRYKRLLNESYNPTGKIQEIFVSDSIDPRKSVNQDGLSDVKNIEWKENPNIGTSDEIKNNRQETRTGIVKVIYNDDSFDEVTVNFIVKPLSERNNPTQKINQQKNISDNIFPENFINLIENSQDIKEYSWEEEISEKEKAGQKSGKVKITYKDDSFDLVDVNFLVREAVILKTDSNQIKPENYVEVKFENGAGNVDKGELEGGDKTYFVLKNYDISTNQTFSIPNILPKVGFTKNNFNEIPATIFTNSKTYTAQYGEIADIIEVENERTQKPDGYKEVVFKTEDTKGTLIGTKKYFVNPNKTVNLTAPTVNSKIGYEFERWDSETNKQFTEEITEINAVYETLEDIIEVENERTEKPDGYVTVIKKTIGLEQNTEKKIYYNPVKNLGISEEFQKVEGYNFKSWKEENQGIVQDTVFDFAQNKATRDITLVGEYIKTFDVNFYESDKQTLIKTEKVEKNQKIEEGKIPKVTKEGTNFIGWRDKFTEAFNNFSEKIITEAVSVYSYFDKSPVFGSISLAKKENTLLKEVKYVKAGDTVSITLNLAEADTWKQGTNKVSYKIGENGKIEESGAFFSSDTPILNRNRNHTVKEGENGKFIFTNIVFKDSYDNDIVGFTPNYEPNPNIIVDTESPKLDQDIDNQDAKVGQNFDFTIPEAKDNYEISDISVSGFENSGLQFDKDSRKITGNPTSESEKNIVVTYTDGAGNRLEKRFVINIAPKDADKTNNNPEAKQNVEIFSGENISPEKFLQNLDRLSDNPRYSWENDAPSNTILGVDKNISETKSGKVKITYNDNSFDLVDITFTVKPLKDKDNNNPTEISKEVFVGENINAESAVEQTGLTDKKEIVWKDEPQIATSEEIKKNKKEQKTATAKVIYNDDSFDEVTVNYTIKPQSERNAPRAKAKQTKNLTDNINWSDFVEGIENSIDKPNYSLVGQEVEKTPGDKTAKVKILYKDGSYDEVDVNFLVREAVILKTDSNQIKPENYVEVKFLNGENGTLENGEKTYFVLKNFDIDRNTTFSIPKILPKVGFTANGFDEVPVTIFVDDKTYTAQYEKIADFIVADDGVLKPNGYKTVTFVTNTLKGTLTGNTKYFVNPNKTLTLPVPQVQVKKGYSFTSWDKNISGKFTEEETIISANYSLNEATVEGKTIDLDSSIPNVSDFVKNKENLPENTTFSWKDGEPNLDKNSTVSITKIIIISSPGENNIEKEVTINFRDNISPTIENVEEKNFISGEEIEKISLNISDNISIKSVEVQNLPDGLNYNEAEKSITGKISESAEKKSYEINIIVSDTNNNFTTKKFNLIVSAQSRKYNLETEKQIIEFGENILAENSISNKQNLPQKTNYSWKDGQADVSTIGLNKKSIVIATFPDNSRKEIEVSYDLVDTQKPTISGEKNISLEVGSDEAKNFTISSGITANDNYDKNLNPICEVNPEFKPLEVGIYTVTCTVSDSSNNSVEENFVRTIKVNPANKQKLSDLLKKITDDFADKEGKITNKNIGQEVKTELEKAIANQNLSSEKINEIFEKYKETKALRDEENPVGNITINKTNPTNSDVILTLEITDKSDILEIGNSWERDANNPKKFTKTFSQNQNVEVRFSDIYGNEGNTNFNITNIDKTKPEGQITGNADSWTKEDVTLTLKTTKPVLKPDGWEKINETTFTKNIPSNSIETFKVVDLVGNDSVDITYNVSKIDKEKPVVVTLDVVGNEKLIKDSTVKINFSASDTGGSGVNSFECKLNDGNFVPCQSEFTFDNLEEGENKIEVIVKDHAGNVSDPKNISITKDSIAPKFLNLENKTFDEDKEITPIEIQTDDNDAKLSAEKIPNGLNFDSILKKITGVILEPGEYEVILKAIDKAKNESTGNFKINILDKTAPEITLNGAETISLVKGRNYQELGATCRDNFDKTCDVKISGQIDKQQLGEQTITYSAVDKAGNGSQKTRKVTVISGDVPVITILGENPVTVELGANYTDASATANDAEDGIITDNIVTKNEVNTGVIGEYKVTYNVSDSSQNQAPEMIRTVKIVDTTKPKITKVENKEFDEKTEINPISIEVSDLNPVLNITVNNLPTGLVFDKTTKQITGQTENIGTHNIEIVAIDGSGNEQKENFEIKILDKTPPKVNISEPKIISKANVSNYEISGTCTFGDNEVSIKIGNISKNATCEQNGIYKIYLDLSSLEDSENIKVSASQTDNSGNKSDLVEKNIKKDTTSPVINLEDIKVKNSLNGDGEKLKNNSITLKLGTGVEFNAFLAKVIDEKFDYLRNISSENDIISNKNIKSSNGIFKITEVGNYEFRFKTKDSVGNESDEVILNIIVEENTKKDLEDKIKGLKDKVKNPSFGDEKQRKELEKVIKEAEKVLGNPNSTKKEIEDILKKIDYTLSKKDLEDKIKGLKDKVKSPSIADEEQRKELEKLVKEAEKILGNPNSTKKEIEDILKKIDDILSKVKYSYSPTKESLAILNDSRIIVPKNNQILEIKNLEKKEETKVEILKDTLEKFREKIISGEKRYYKITEKYSSCPMIPNIVGNYNSSFSIYFNDLASITNKDEVQRLTKTGILNEKGVNNTNLFEPKRGLTRAEFLAIVLQVHCYDISEKPKKLPFPDVNLDSWQAKAVKVGNEIGLINGYKDGTFRPNANISKIEAFGIMMKMAEINIKDNYKNRYTDQKASWQEKPLSDGEYLGIIKPEKTDFRFYPDRNLSRDEMVKLIVDIIRLY